MFWEITFFDGSYGYITALTAEEALRKARRQNWNQNPQNITGLRVVDNGLGPEVADGWHSSTRELR